MKRVSLVRIFALSLFILPTVVFADDPSCGSIIVPEDFWYEDSDEERESISDCADPFRRTDILTGLFIQGEEVVDGGTYEIPAGSILDAYGFEGEGYSQGEAPAEYYLHVDQDYVRVHTEFLEPTESEILVSIQGFFNGQESQVTRYHEILISDDPFSYFYDNDFNPIWDAVAQDWVENVYEELQTYIEENTVTKRTPLSPGTYTAVVIEEGDPILAYNTNFIERLFSRLIPYAYAETGDVHAVTFTIVEEAEDTMDPLLLEYLPTLRMHPDEDFLPMNVEAFVGASALWDDAGILPDELVQEAGNVSLETLSSLDDGEDHYLAFSDPDHEKTINVSAGLEKYMELVEEGEAKTTVYAHKMEDSFEDAFGITHEYIVLQYWYFYAMNDWKEKGGLNNHEGDWESVFVFLDKDSEEPKYVAFSSHLNDGEPEGSFVQYDSVRREWSDEDIERNGTNVMSYVALGSHANYSKPGDYTVNVLGDKDSTSMEGEYINQEAFEKEIEMNEDETEWLQYEGKWGSDGIFKGNDGPQGPYFIDVSGHLRFHDPLAWAGIDKIEEMVTEEPTASFSFPSSDIKLNFGSLIPAGTELSTAPYFESPSGTVSSDTQLYAPFWDIESDLENGTFQTEVHLPISDELLSSTDSTHQLNAYWFDPETETWEEQVSSVDNVNDSVVFSTNHFSRYAIGIKTISEPDTEERHASGSTATRTGERDRLAKPSDTPIEDVVAGTEIETAAYERLIMVLKYILAAYTTKGYMTSEEIGEANQLLNEV
jgi:hypothetical protein